jgi:hypothetical protein
VSDIIDVNSLDSIPVPPGTLELETRQLLARLGLVISGLPSTIPLVSDTDPILSFSVNPVTLVGPGQDAWEDVIHGKIDSLMYKGGRPKNSIELSQSVRRREIGMAGLAKWLERCFFGLHIPLGMLKPRIERLIEAMLFTASIFHVYPISTIYNIVQGCEY